MKLEEDIQQLAEKLEKFRRNLEAKNFKTRKCNNFDKQAALLQKQLKMFRGTSDEICVKKIQEMAEVSLSIKSKSRVTESLVSSDNSNVSTTITSPILLVVSNLIAHIFYWLIFWGNF